LPGTATFAPDDPMRPELIEATRLLRSNDAESVSEAIGLLQNTVYAFSMKVCGHPEDAEDTMQEVLVRSLPHLAKISDPRALAVWLYTVTRNRCWRMRRKAVHAPKQTLSLDELMPDESELGLLLQDAGANPERQVLEGEQNHLLHQAILSVPPQYRIVLVLHDIEDLDTEQIAQVLDVLPGTVRVRLHRARLYVRKAMAQLVERTPVVELRDRRPRKRPHKKTDAARPPRECQEIFANLSEYLDGKVNVRTCEEMRQHIEACPACIAFIHDLRQAIDRCRKLEIACDPEIALRLRSLLTREYLRMLGLPVPQNNSSIL
jgi:RNA polymerase sigma-70 factor (ECF subfamily)